jgi:Fe-S cluster biogenesis protein NfuA
MDNLLIIEKIHQVLNELQPMIQSHNGAIEFVKLEDDIVYVRLQGACIGCPASLYTLTFGVEERLKEQLPQIQGVLPVID